MENIGAGRRCQSLRRTILRSPEKPWPVDFASQERERRQILDSIESLEAFAREHGPGRYDVDEHSLDPFPGTKVSARAWGKVIHHQDGQVVLDPIPWQA